MIIIIITIINLFDPDGPTTIITTGIHLHLDGEWQVWIHCFHSKGLQCQAEIRTVNHMIKSQVNEPRYHVTSIMKKQKSEQQLHHRKCGYLFLISNLI